MNPLLQTFKYHRKSIAYASIFCIALPGCFPCAFFAGGIGVGISLWEDRDIYLSTKEVLLIGVFIGFFGSICSLLALLFINNILLDFFSNALTPQSQARFLLSLNKHGSLFNLWVVIHITLSVFSSATGAHSTLKWVFPERTIPSDL